MECPIYYQTPISFFIKSKIGCAPTSASHPIIVF